MTTSADEERVGGSESRPPSPADVPICVDLDGTLLRTDTLFELVMIFLRENPAGVLRLVLWLFRGKAYFKEQLSRAARLDTASLPVKEPLLEFLKAEKAKGRKIFLATAANFRLARQVVANIPIFSGFFASDHVTNLAGRAKLQSLVHHFPNGFLYAGNCAQDVAVWKGSAGAIVVDASSRLVNSVAETVPVLHVFPRERSPLRFVLRQMRIHQWVKNTLIFLPLVGAHRIGDSVLMGHALLAFLSFGLCASAVYTINDLLDLKADRAHPQKRHRPLAAGHLSPRFGVFLAAAFLAAGLLTALALPVAFAILLCCYLLGTVSYSVVLKRYPILDVLVLAGFYTVRVFAGELATGIRVSEWLLTFAMFFFLSLALLKRYSELKAKETSGSVLHNGRGYQVTDADALASLGGAAGYMAVLVFAFYINSDDVQAHYSAPRYLWLAVPLLLYWISRIWLLAGRGQVDHDPVVFSFKDRVTCAIVVMIGALLIVSGPL